MSDTDQAAPSADLRTTTSTDGTAVVEVGGAVDAATYRSIGARLNTLIDSEPPAIVLDLRGVDFMGSVGLAMLVNAEHHARRLRIPFALVANTRSVLRPLRATRMDQALTPHATLDQALAAVRRTSN